MASRRLASGAFVAVLALSEDELEELQAEAKRLFFPSLSSYLIYASCEDGGKLDLRGCRQLPQPLTGGEGLKNRTVARSNPRHLKKSIYLKREAYDVVKIFADQHALSVQTYIRCRGLGGVKHAPPDPTADLVTSLKKLGATKLRHVARDLLKMDLTELADFVMNFRLPFVPPKEVEHSKRRKKMGLGIYAWSIEFQRPVLLGEWPKGVFAPEVPRSIPSTLEGVMRDFKTEE